MLKSITPPRTFRPTAAQIEAYSRVLAAQAEIDRIEPIVRGYQSDILARGQWRVATEWVDADGIAATITDPAHAWLMPDADHGEYLRQCRAAQLAAGLPDLGDCCPLLVAQDDLRRARDDLVDALQPITGISWRAATAASMRDADQFADCAIRLMAVTLC